jgi:hypothetical protein
MSTLSSLQLRVLELHYEGMPPKEIAKKVHRNAKEIMAIIELHAKKPELQLGFRGMQKLAREAGLSPLNN